MAYGHLPGGTAVRCRVTGRIGKILRILPPKELQARWVRWTDEPGYHLVKKLQLAFVAPPPEKIKVRPAYGARRVFLHKPSRTLPKRRPAQAGRN